jgi:hypothetical protein
MGKWEVSGARLWVLGSGDLGGVKADLKFKIQDAIAKTPYDGISPEVVENNNAAAQEFGI